MKITAPRPPSPGPARSRRVARGAKGAEFSIQVTGEPASAKRASPASPLGPLEGLLALQEVPEAVHGRSRGVARGHDLLDRLDEVRHALLVGAIPRDRLVELRRRVRARKGDVGDPRLSAVLDEIDLRAAVELAKLGMTP